MIAKFRPRGRRPLPETEDFLEDNNRLTVADEDVFTRDPVNLIRMFRLAQKHNLVLHPDAMRAATQVAQARSTRRCGTTPRRTGCFSKSSPRTTPRSSCGG